MTKVNNFTLRQLLLAVEIEDSRLTRIKPAAGSTNRFLVNWRREQIGTDRLTLELRVNALRSALKLIGLDCKTRIELIETVLGEQCYLGDHGEIHPVQEQKAADRIRALLLAHPNGGEILRSEMKVYETAELLVGISVQPVSASYSDQQIIRYEFEGEHELARMVHIYTAPVWDSEWLVMNDDESTEQYEAWLDGQLADGDQIPGQKEPGFDPEKWKDINRTFIGRGGVFASADREERQIRMTWENGEAILDILFGNGALRYLTSIDELEFGGGDLWKQDESFFIYKVK